MNAISSLDIGLINCNIDLSKISEIIISYLYDGNGKFIDYGGGYGTFVRIMRDNGFKFFWQEVYCKNLFAEYFEVSKSSSDKFEVLTAFEVFEHLEEPQF